ncbi:uncharacterized protein V1510DRAFT_421576 [Dipodascopsis tothii]|uniref:uncharacterized protein n=1 Tax=Dipodascopsis tothii TaxID=44089 RepID=UPI0034CF4FC8
MANQNVLFPNQGQYGQQAPSPAANNLQFYSSNYDSASSYGMRPAGSSSSLGSTYFGSAGAGAGQSAATGERLSEGWLAAFGTGGYSDEPPLLEELGINFGHIKTKTLLVLNPFSSAASLSAHRSAPSDPYLAGRAASAAGATGSSSILDDSDLAGPILFCLLFGTCLLFSGKVHFGYIYGVALLGTVSLHLILNLMASQTIAIVRTASLLGYCLLPLVVAAALGVVVKMDSFFGYIFSVLAIVWCTYSASAMFVDVLQVHNMRFLVAYPLGLFYSVFAVMSIFADTPGSA